MVLLILILTLLIPFALLSALSFSIAFVEFIIFLCIITCTIVSLRSKDKISMFGSFLGLLLCIIALIVESSGPSRGGWEIIDPEHYMSFWLFILCLASVSISTIVLIRNSDGYGTGNALTFISISVSAIIFLVRTGMWILCVVARPIAKWIADFLFGP